MSVPDRNDLDDVVAELLGRRPQGAYEVVLARPDGTPVVLANAPLLDDGRPMPTRFWLTDPRLNKVIGRLEALGGVKEAERTVDIDRLKQAHDAYAAQRSELIPAGYSGPLPTGGVGGTRQGVKCLHAHYAHFLAGGDDPVGAWVHGKLAESGDEFPVVSPKGEPTPATWFVEIGSGSVKWRLPRPDGTFDGDSRFVGLAKSMSDVDVLSESGRTKLDAALSDLAVVMEQRQLGAPMVVGCEVVRRSTQARATVAELVEHHLGSTLQVLSSEHEAALALKGAIAARGDRTPDTPVVIFDVGSASTEISAAGPGGTSGAWFSMQLGGHSVARDYFAGDPPDPGELSAALSVIELNFDDLRRESPELVNAVQTGVVVGTGAFPQIAAVEIGTDISSGPDPVHGYVLDHESAEEIFRVLATESRADRRHNPGLLPEHVDGVVGALCIVVEFMRQFSIERIEVSVAGVLDGLVEHHRAGDAKLGL